MMRLRCPRSFEVEAMRDGRLAGAELASFACHMSVCAACAREARALEALAEAVRAESHERADTDELRLWRERTRLLAAFDRTLLAPETRRRAPRLLLPAAIAAMVAGFLVTSRMRIEPRRTQPVSVDIRPEPQARWTERTEDGCKKVFLASGSLRIHVDHASAKGGFLVELPDGELEDRGTTFTVSAENGHTTRVAVEEGSVVLRLTDRSAMTIAAGGAWIRESNVAARDVSVAPAPSPTPPRHAGARPHGVALSPPDDPTGDFRAAMSLLDVGANRSAAAGFASFVEAHPRDPRAEDAAYLLVIALQRSGSEGESRRAAQDYLRRHPAGFRRAEVEKLSH